MSREGADRHYSVQKPRVRIGRSLQVLHGPAVHHCSHLRTVSVDQAEACHVHATVAVGLQVQGEKVLQPGGSDHPADTIAYPPQKSDPPKSLQI